MSGFTKVVTLTTPQPDPAKRVNYTQGLVMGVDEFTQEFAYLSGRTEWLTRDLLGYGTATGLQVQAPKNADASKGPLVVVTAGTAVSPSGRLIRVATAQQADLDAWLASQTREVNRRADSSAGSPPSDAIAAHVVLCYRACPDDDRPVPGERCRDDDGPTVPSRVRDDFHLALRFDPPDQREDDASARFVHWLTQVEVTDAGDDFLTLDQFIGEIRRGAPFPAGDLGSTPSLASPPKPIRIRPRDACEYMDAAFRVWVTELRPVSMRPTPAAAGCDVQPPVDDCVLLATLEIPIVWSDRDRGWRVDRRAEISIDERRRPYLVHLRALQQWLLCEAERWPELDGDVTGPPGRTTVERLRHVPIAASPPPGDRQVLTFDGASGQWRPDHPVADNQLVTETTFGQAAAPGVSTSLSRADHTHGTPTLPLSDKEPPGNVFGQTGAAGASGLISRADHRHATPALPFSDKEPPAIVFGQTGAAGVSTLISRADHRHATPALPFSDKEPPAIAFGQTGAAGTSTLISRADHRHAAPALPALGGDVTGALGSNAIGSIQTVPIIATGAASGQVLTFTAGAWRPGDPGTATGSFVERPAGQPSYAIVAAGIIHATTGTPIVTPSYNGLRLVKFGAGTIILTFNNIQPIDRLQYIVKVLPVTTDRAAAVAVTMGRFFGGAFDLFVTLNGTPLPIDQFGQFRFMVEVSEYQVG
jgi:hypothetical protein